MARSRMSTLCYLAVLSLLVSSCATMGTQPFQSSWEPVVDTRKIERTDPKKAETYYKDLYECKALAYNNAVDQEVRSQTSVLGDTTIGALLGGIGGTVIGAATGNPAKGAVIGAASGGMLGAGSGLMSSGKKHQDLQQLYKDTLGHCLVHRGYGGYLINYRYQK